MLVKKNKNRVFSFGATQMNMCKYLLVVLLALALPAFANVKMTDVNFSSLPGGKVEMRFDFDAPPPIPKAYTIQSPARIALDLDKVSSGLKQKKHTLDLGNAQSVVVVDSPERTRVIVNLVELTKYDARVEGNTLIVTVGNDGVKDYLKAAPAQLDAKVKQQAISAVKSVDFRRGENNEGRLVVELTNPNINVDSHVEGKFIKLSFEQTSLPENLRLNYDVSDFATPVMMVKANEVNGNTMIDLEPTGEYEYLAYQTDNTYVLTVKPLSKEDIAAKKKEFEFVGDKLSLNFQDIEVRAVLQLIADFTDLNLVASDSVTGKITLRLQNVPWDQALDLILKTKGLDKRQDGNVLLVAPAAEIAKTEEQQLTNQKQLEELAPLQTEFIRIKYAEAADIEKLLKSGGQGADKASSKGLLSKRASVVVDKRTNSILVTETAAKLEDIRKLINLVDVAIRQVLIEARIVIASSDETAKLGVQWGGNVTHKGSNGGLFMASSSQNNTVTMANAAGTGGTITTGNVVDLGVSDRGSTHMNLGFLNASGTRFLDLELSALQSSGNGEIVAQPKLITGDKQEASIKSGVQVPYQESAPNGAATTAYKDAVLELKVTPNITPDDRIIMDLNIKQDSLGSTSVSGAPTIDTTEIKTKVLVNNGETVVLGGIYQSTDLVSEIKTPFLGDIPYIGRLFKRTSHVQDKTEILIFITPRILADSLVQ